MPVSRNGTTVQVPATARIFVLEDSEKRQMWFMNRIPDACFHAVPEEAIEFLATLPVLPDVCFLDCDLHWSEELPGRKRGGIRVAAFLARLGFIGRVVIHSVNEKGAA